MSKFKVLVVDDDDDAIFALESILSRAKYKVFKARSGREGIEQAKKFSPDIILMDIMMPELDGIATILKMKGIQEISSIPVIVLTAVEGQEDEIVAKNLGVVDYIRKTSQMEDVIAKIERALNR